MTTDETVAVWGCVVCSHVLMQGDRLMDGVFAAMWLIFAAFIIWASKRDRKDKERRAADSADDARDA
jgi:hypothetical protein